MAHVNIFGIDGTLTDAYDGEYNVNKAADAIVNPAVVKKLRNNLKNKENVVFFTYRQECDYRATCEWLRKQVLINIPIQSENIVGIFMRPMHNTDGMFLRIDNRLKLFRMPEYHYNAVRDMGFEDTQMNIKQIYLDHLQKIGYEPINAYDDDAQVCLMYCENGIENVWFPDLDGKPENFRERMGL